MSHTLAILARQTLAAVLVVCVSVCCCQAHVVMQGLSGPDPAAAGEPVACASSGCCQNAPDPPAEPDDDQTPDKRCQTCCVKGTGLKDTILVLPQLVTLAASAHDPAPALTAAPAAPDLPLGPAAVFEPPTLVRLRCALVV